MSVPSYAADRHHVGLGEDADSLSGFITIGPIAKERATALFEKPSNVGSVEDLIGSRTHSVWTQDDFSGGEFQLDWSDPAMFSECVGMLPNQLGRSLVTARPLIADNLNDTGGNLDPISADVVDGALFITFNSTAPQGKVARYTFDGAAPNVEIIDTAHLPAGRQITAAYWNLTSERIWIASDQPEINIFAWDKSAADGNRLVHKQRLKAPTYAADPVTRVSGIQLFGALKFISTRHGDGFLDDNRVWLHVSGSGDDTKWKQVGTLPGDYITSVVYNNAVYFLTRKGDSRTQLSMSQGDQVFPVLDLPYAFRGLAMIEYAGRLFISGIGYALDGTPDHGELYEVNGTSLRLVRTWASEGWRPEPPTDQWGIPGTPRPRTRRRKMTHMAALAVCEGLLWMPDSSYTGLEAYDATTDGFFGGARLGTGDDPDLEFTELVAIGSTIYAWATHPTLAVQGWYRTGGIVDEVDPHECYVSTSDFHPEPARMKVWSRATIHSRGKPVSLFYSQDAGDTWTEVAADATNSFGYRYETSFNLAAIPESRLIRLRVAFEMTGAALTDPVAELVALSLSFLVRGENKKRWTFTVNASEAPADLDNRMMAQVPSEILTRVWTLAEQDAPLTFRDTDGADYLVIVGAIHQAQPVLTDGKEAYVNLDLTEV